jgi:preprotein translocase subunit SecF
MNQRLTTVMDLQEWISRLLYTVVTLLAPLAVIVANAVWNFGGILLTIGMIVWIGFSLVILSPLLE